MGTELLAAGGGALQSFLLQVMAFALLVFVLVKFVKPVLGKALGERTKGIEETFTKIEQETAETARQLADIQQKLADLGQETLRRQKASMEEAQKLRDQALADAGAQSQALLDKAQREIQVERDKAVKELRETAENLTLRAADHLVQATMNDAHQQRLVDSYLGRIEGVQKP